MDMDNFEITRIEIEFNGKEITQLNNEELKKLIEDLNHGKVRYELRYEGSDYPVNFRI